MALIKTSYPATSSVALTITLASLASDTNLLVGRASTAVDNTTNNDIDHLLSGGITTGTSPTAGTIIEVWAWASYKTVSGTPTYAPFFSGTDSAATISSTNSKLSAVRQLTTITVDSTSARTYFFTPVSIAALFGSMPKFWGVFVVHNTGVALSSVSGNHDIQYERIQNQTV